MYIELRRSLFTSSGQVGDNPRPSSLTFRSKTPTFFFLASIKTT